jgi:hypothetical protein
LTRALALASLLALAACSGAQDRHRSDWEDANAARLEKEGDAIAPVVLPPAPQADHLVEFTVDKIRDFRFYVDASTLTVNRDGVVRYVLVARSQAGADNVTYEGLTCRSAEYRLYATGRPGGSWQEQRVPWRPVAMRAVQRTLMDDYFCPRRVLISSAAEAVMALRRGRHPLADPAPSTSGR